MRKKIPTSVAVEADADEMANERADMRNEELPSQLTVYHLLP